MEADYGRQRVVITNVQPQVQAGRFPAKASLGEAVTVEADIFADGHDVLSARLLYRRPGDADWTEIPMTHRVNDRWQASFHPDGLGVYEVSLTAWIDRFATWRRNLARKHAAGVLEAADLREGALLLRKTAASARGEDARTFTAVADVLDSEAPTPGAVKAGLDQGLALLVEHYAERPFAATCHRNPFIRVEREKARFSAWYEMFPRSASKEPGRHGTFLDVIERLPYVAGMGFDVLYLPPIHPIGRTHRKGANNTQQAGPEDPGSPWAIGSEEGGHMSVHPALGTMEDFRLLVDEAREVGLEIALDIAFQCSPDHPWVREHPGWFRRRPDGSIQYAENPPKKYEDIYPLDFETDDWKNLWEALEQVLLFWAEAGVRIFRVDNPHTKTFGFWKWVIQEVQRVYPDAIFLAEAFTRPKVMYHLAKSGFSQSYTYFAWRNTAGELTDYFAELSRPPVRDFFRPNLWPNTPDILPEHLQVGGRPEFRNRLLLAATLGANYGIYGPAFELCVDLPREQGGEEYLDSEKYQIRHWDLEHPDNLRDFIARVNKARRENPALQHDRNLRFHRTDNEMLLCYSKTDESSENTVLVVVNLDPHYTQSGWIDLPLEALEIDTLRSFQMHDLISDARFIWSGPRNYIELDPRSTPGHIFRIRKKLRTEKDFDYFM
ncbi:MAG: alpha-1,4-glucan--maltose-1-phosphate maltosyltransferase [Thermodesulfobacteriota bacterium]